MRDLKRAGLIPRRRKRIQRRYIVAGGIAPITLPQNLLLFPGTLYEDFETVGEWTAANGSVAANAVEFRTGTQSVKLTTNAGANATMTKTINTTFGNFGQIKLWLYIHDAIADYSSSITLSFAHEAGFTNTYRAWISNAGSTAFRTGEWNLFAFPKSYFKVQAGAPNWANPMVRMRLAFTGAATKTPSVSFDSLYTEIRGIPAVMMHFDDGSAEQYDNCFAVMQPHNIRGTLWAETDYVPGGSGMGWAHLHEMENAGWTVGNHTNANVNLATLSEAQQEAQILGGKNDLIAQGFSSGLDYLAYPTGNYNADTFTAMDNLGVLTGRSIMMNDSSTTTPYCVNLIGETPSKLLRSSGANTTALTEALAEGEVNKAIADGNIIAMHFHRVGTGVEWSVADFQTFINFLVSKKSQICSITMDDYYRLTLGPVQIPR